MEQFLLREYRVEVSQNWVCDNCSKFTRECVSEAREKPIGSSQKMKCTRCNKKTPHTRAS